MPTPLALPLVNAIPLPLISLSLVLATQKHWPHMTRGTGHSLPTLIQCSRHGRGGGGAWCLGPVHHIAPVWPVKGPGSADARARSATLDPVGTCWSNKGQLHSSHLAVGELSGGADHQGSVKHERHALQVPAVAELDRAAAAAAATAAAARRRWAFLARWAEPARARAYRTGLRLLWDCYASSAPTASPSASPTPPTPAMPARAEAALARLTPAPMAVTGAATAPTAATGLSVTSPTAAPAAATALAVTGAATAPTAVTPAAPTPAASALTAPLDGKGLTAAVGTGPTGAPTAATA